MACVLAMYGDEPETPGANLGLIRGWGAEVRWTGDPDRASVDPAMEKAVAELEAAGRRPYLVPRGGATAIGALGYLDAAGELAGQLEAAGVEPELIVVAAGSCGTLAGLHAGRAAHGLPGRLVGASVSRPLDECEERVLRIATEAAELAGTAGPRASDVSVVDARGPAYAEPSEESDAAARLAADTEGLLLDHVFTAKAMAAFLSMAGDGPSVFVHTGGIVAAIERAGGGGHG
ncbi:MAG TPA: pyridoxal-phosphate dependent enzyme [Actinomycetota bacterium]